MVYYPVQDRMEVLENNNRPISGSSDKGVIDISLLDALTLASSRFNTRKGGIVLYTAEEEELGNNWPEKEEASIDKGVILYTAEEGNIFLEKEEVTNPEQIKLNRRMSSSMMVDIDNDTGARGDHDHGIGSTPGAIDDRRVIEPDVRKIKHMMILRRHVISDCRQFGHRPQSNDVDDMNVLQTLWASCQTYLHSPVCKWAIKYLVYIHHPRSRLKRQARSSLTWVILQRVRAEEARAREVWDRTSAQLNRFELEGQHALACCARYPVRKYGRKGTPHWTHLCLDVKAETLSWTRKLNKLVRVDDHQHHVIRWSDITDIKCGCDTIVFQTFCMKKKKKKEKTKSKTAVTLIDPAKCFSIITRTRTLDLEAESAVHRDWLLTSLESVVLKYVSTGPDRHHHRPLVVQHQIQIDQVITRIQNIPWMTKFGRKGKPHRTCLTVDLASGTLAWKGKRKARRACLALTDIRAIQPGCSTWVFQRQNKSEPENAHRCLSILTRERTLDLRLETESTRDYLVVALRYIVEKCHDQHPKLVRPGLEHLYRLVRLREVENPPHPNQPVRVGKNPRTDRGLDR